MSSMIPFNTKFESVDSIVNYLREPSPPEVVSSSTTSSAVDSTKINNGVKSTKKQKKEKELANTMKATQATAEENVQISVSGRVRYGPITVNPRKQPSKTLFTGRRSKYEILPGDEDEKRRLRRERNRAAATKCREKREHVLGYLEAECNKEEQKYAHLSQLIARLEQRKQHLQLLVSNQLTHGSVQQNNPTPQQQPSMVFGDPASLTSITETFAPSLSTHQLQIIQNNAEEFSHILQPTATLTNSAYTTDQSDYFLIPDQQSQQTITMNSSSLERLINSLQSPTPYVDNNNNNYYSGLFNSAYGSSTCAQQHSSSSEDDSLPPTHKNSYVC